MKQGQQNMARNLGLAILAGVTLGLASCSSTSKDAPAYNPGPDISGSAGFGGAVIVDTVTTNGTIVALNPKQRRIQLRFADGSTNAYTAGPEVANFSRLKVGDKVTTTVSEQMGVEVAKPGAPANATNRVSTVRGPSGIGGSAVEVQTVTGKFIGFNDAENVLILQQADGQTRRIKLMSFVDPRMLIPGETVTVKITESKVFQVQSR